MNNKHSPEFRSRRSIDGLMRPLDTSPAQLHSKPAQEPRSVNRQEAASKQQLAPITPSVAQRKQTKARGIKNTLTYLGIIVLAIAVGIAIINAQVGQWLAVVSGIIALILRTDSRIIFGAALFCLVMVPILNAFNSQLLSENYALYAFIFLVIGTIRAMIEAAGPENSLHPPFDT